MAFSPGYKGDFRLDNAAGSLTNLQPYIDTVSVSQPTETIDVSVLGTVSKAFIAGMQDGSISISGPYDPAISTHLSGIRAAQAAGTAGFSFQWGPGGAIAGQAKVTGEALLTSFDLSTGVTGRSEYSASLQITGAVTNASFA